MPEPTPTPNHPERWIDGYLNGELDGADAKSFERWLLEDVSHVERLARAVLQDTQLRAAIVGRRLESGFSMLSDAGHETEEQLKAIDQDHMYELVDQALALRRQHEIEDAANAMLIADQASSAQEQRYARARQQQQLKNNGSRTVVIPQTVIWLGIAAMLGIAATVIHYVNRPAAPVTNPSVVEQAPEEHQPSQPAPVLAILVRTLDAQWADAASAWDGPLGLRQGRHTLTQGLAEIELAEGTRVVLEAPVSFDLTGANAMALADGRLVATVPPSGVGFTVDTPTARIIDYGTEFGVDADGDRQTQVQVFKGEVRAASRVEGVVVGQSVALLEEQAAAIDAGGASIARVAFDDTAFERRVVKRLDLVDIVAGGDGTGQARMRALHPVTGRSIATPILSRGEAHLPSNGRYQPVSTNRFIDGVFAPHRGDNIQVDSAGHTVSGLSVSDPMSYQLIWAGGVMPSVEAEELRGEIGRLYPQIDPDQAPVLYMIPNKGITIDLDALRAGHGLQGEVQFSMVVENLSQRHREFQPVSPRFDVHCYLDGEIAEQVTGLTPEDGGVEVAFTVPAHVRFLTLVAVDSGDHISRDWVVFHRPELVSQTNTEGANR